MRSRLNVVNTALLMAAGVLCAAVGQAQAAPSRVSVATGGAQANDQSGFTVSGELAISRYGRFVAFMAYATNLVKGDTNGVPDIFVRDRDRGTTERVSLSSSGAQANGDSSQPSISGDGRYVAFVSRASNLVPGGTPGLYVRDRKTGHTRRLSIGGEPSISWDGRFVAFLAVNLLPGETSNKPNIYVRDLQKNTAELVSVATNGTRSDGNSFAPAISANGRYVVFDSDANNLVLPHHPDVYNVYLRDLQTKTTVRIDRGLGGALPSAGYGGRGPRVSGDGRYVTFASDSDNLVPGVTDGQYHIFVFDRRTATTRIVDLSPAGVRSYSSFDPFDLSADGRFVAFSTAYFPDAVSTLPQVYLRDLQANTTVLVSAGLGGAPANGSYTDTPLLSQHGRVVAFSSDATNLVRNDTNGVRDEFVQVYPPLTP